MRAILVEQFGGPEVLRVSQVPDPQPAADDVLIRIHTAGVNPVDAYIRSGNYARLPQLPYTPGSDGAGIVEARGANVCRFNVGDRVYIAALGVRFGTYAEKMACPAHLAHPLPDRVSFAQGAALGVPAATAYRALVLRAQVRAAETLLVHGASGAVGVAATQLARAFGLRVFGTAGSPRGMEVARQAGAERVFNHREEGYAASITEATGGRGVDVILEMLANVNLDRDLMLLAPKGRVVIIGNRGRTEIDPRQTMGKELAVLGTTLWSTTPEEYKQIHAGLRAALETGILRPIIGREYPLEDAPAAHRAVLEEPAAGKIVLTV